MTPKGKNEIEASGDYLGIINKSMILLEGESAKSFGENTEKVKELCEIFLKIERSGLFEVKINPRKRRKKKKKENKESARKSKKNIVIDNEEAKVYESAKTKFYHEDTFFAIGAKGLVNLLN